MNNRDWDYIETRLLDPTHGAIEAHERMITVGEVESAKRLMEAIKTFTDAARAIRRDMTDRRNREGNYDRF